MVCKCGREMEVDGTIGTEERMRITYVCLDPRCPEYLKAVTSTGESVPTQIKEK